eukprot:m.197449 g.197449  ORF g.197449 m.197449 type:complete len:293 (-) comp18720_c0_seq2:197-1075(-)
MSWSEPASSVGKNNNSSMSSFIASILGAAGDTAANTNVATAAISAVSVAAATSIAFMTSSTVSSSPTKRIFLVPGLITGTAVIQIFIRRLQAYFAAEPVVSPHVVIVFSGKRKSGKDYVTEILHDRLGTDRSEILRLSGPLKAQYAMDHNLDLQELLSASAYKEQHRKPMILWGEAKRDADPGYFARLTTEKATKPIWIISDARRPTDLTYFQTRYPTISVRVQCPDSVRAARRWVFTPGVDDAASECGLDKREWDIVIDNDGDAQKLEEQLSELIQLVTVHCRTSTGQPML